MENFRYGRLSGKMVVIGLAVAAIAIQSFLLMLPGLASFVVDGDRLLGPWPFIYGMFLVWITISLMSPTIIALGILGRVFRKNVPGRETRYWFRFFSNQPEKTTLRGLFFSLLATAWTVIVGQVMIRAVTNTLPQFLG